MKIFETGGLLIRLEIKKKGFATEKLVLAETTLNEVYVMVSKLVKTIPPPDGKDSFTSVNIREFVKAKGGKQSTVKCKGTNPYKLLKMLKELI